MTRGAKFLAATAILGLSGCGADRSAQLAIRPLPTPISANAKPVPLQVAEGHGHFVLGNYALALEAYRKALREDQRNVDAMAGLAACYDKMGRFDLSRRYYESALAVAPADRRLLSALARSFEIQGLHRQAQAVHREIAVLRLAAARAFATPRPLATPVEPAAASSVRGESAPMSHSRSDTVALPLATAATPEAPKSDGSAKVAPAPPPAEAMKTAKKRTHKVLGGDVRVRLERLSLGEVALVTSSEPRWTTKVTHRSAQSTTIRFVPLKRSDRSVAVRLLNAARSQGLAARTRTLLAEKGWRKMAIGDASRVRARSMVLYSPAYELAARRLSKQLGFDLVRGSRSGVTVLLGRDSVGLTRSRG